MCEKFINWCGKHKLDLKALLVLLIFCLILDGWIVSDVHGTVGILSGQPSVAEGNITGVSRKNGTHSSWSGYNIYLGEVDYALLKTSWPHSDRTFGIRDDISLESYGYILKGKLGFPVRIEYFQLGESSRRITRLTIYGDEYIDSEAALNDTLAEYTEDLYLSIALFAITFVCLIFVLKCMLVQRGMIE